jgi:hypothetical protein
MRRNGATARQKPGNRNWNGAGFSCKRAGGKGAGFATSGNEGMIDWRFVVGNAATGLRQYCLAFSHPGHRFVILRHLL